MKHFIKINSEVPEFCHYIKEGDGKCPDGFKEITEEDFNKMREDMEENPFGSVIGGVWVK